MLTVGAVAHLTGTFTDATGALVDLAPNTVTITKQDGTAAVTAAATVHDSTGKYHYDYITVTPGIHQFYFTGGSGATAAVQLPDIFTVAPLTTTAIIALGDAKQALNITGTADDEELLLFIRAATHIINYQAGYTVATTVTETLPSTVDRYGQGVVMLSHVPVLSVQTITPLLPSVPTVAVGSTKLDNQSGQLILGTSASFYGPQTVAYTAGRSTAVEALQEAGRIQTQHLWNTQRGASLTPQFGGVDEGGLMAEFGVPLRVRELVKLGGYKKPAGVA